MKRLACGMLYRGCRYTSSVMRRLDNYFPLSDPFHAVLSKTRASGREFARATSGDALDQRSVRARARASDRTIAGCIVIEIASAAHTSRIIIYSDARHGIRI